MERFLVASLLCLGAAVWQVGGQTCPATDCYFTDVATITPTETNPNLYFVIGGLFDIHEKGETAITCGTEMSTEGIVSAMAFFWAINRYRDLIDSRVQIGAIAYDNCMRPEQTIENMLGFAQCKINIQRMAQQNLVAYVGPYSNEDVRSSAQLATDVGVTMVSPGADAVDLDLEDTTLLRTSPSFSLETDAILAFLDAVNSSYAIVVYSAEDSFWHHAAMELLEKMGSRNKKICVTYSANIDGHMNDLDDFVKDNLVGVVSQRYVVPLMSLEKVNMLLGAVNQNGDVRGRLRFIMASQIHADLGLLTSNGNAAQDAILIVRDKPTNVNTADLDAFKDYVRNGASSAITNLNNPWVDQYKLQHNGMLPTFDDSAEFALSDIASRTMLSVKTVIEGMARALRDCDSLQQNYQICDKYRNQRFKNNLLYRQIRDALNLFDASTGQLRNSEIEYAYLHFENLVGMPVRFTRVGTYRYSPSGFAINLENLQDTTKYGNAFATPDCSGIEECCRTPTTVAPSTTQDPNNGGRTTPVPPDQTTKGGYSEVRYRRGQAITGAFPYDLDEDDREEWGTRFDLGQRWIIALGVLAGLGIVCVIVFEIYILYKLLGTRLGHKWRTMWLGQLLLFGIFLSYLTLFAYLFIPTKATCGITRFGVGVSYAICFAVLLVKLMVILTSKTSDVLLPGDESPNYLKGIYQFLMFIFAVGVQVVIDVQWMITVPPEAVQVTSNNGEKVWICNHYTWEAGKGMDNMATFVRTNFENHVLSLIYIMVMILITTILSLNAHGIITNHRESVFIGIAAGFSIPIWLAWTLVGGLNYEHEYSQEFGDACIAFGLFCTATLIMFAMFLPKVRQLVNMGVEGIYLEDDRDTYYAGSVIMAPPSYKSKGPSSVIYVNNQGIYSEPVVMGNGDPSKEDATHLKHPGSTYSAPPTYLKKPESAYGSTRVLRVTDDLRGRHPQKRPQSEVAYGTAGRPRSQKGTLTRSKSQTSLGAL